ncbi:MAG: hypothetical protein OHK0029_02470 [Armatimonadaceae bacterium]
MQTTALSFEILLSDDWEFAMREGSRFFAGEGAVQDALRRITRRLNELNIDYAVAGGMALFFHGFRRFTEDVDILVTPEALQKIHESLQGRGYRPPFDGSKNLQDTESGVRIEFIITGQFPGDGKPKPVAFPNPADASIEYNGVRFLNLPTLVELKLASGISSPARLKDLADVQELIKLLELPEDFGEQLSSYVRSKYTELWQAVAEERSSERE